MSESFDFADYRFTSICSIRKSQHSWCAPALKYLETTLQRWSVWTRNRSMQELKLLKRGCCPDDRHWKHMPFHVWFSQGHFRAHGFEMILELVHPQKVWVSEWQVDIWCTFGNYVEAIHQPAHYFHWGLHTLYLAWQASAWLTSRAKRGLRQTATATDTTVREGASRHSAAGDAVAHDDHAFLLGIENKRKDTVDTVMNCEFALAKNRIIILFGGVHTCLTFNPHGFGLITITGLGRPESTNHIFGLDWTVDFICVLSLHVRAAMRFSSVKLWKHYLSPK